MAFDLLQPSSPTATEACWVCGERDCVEGSVRVLIDSIGHIQLAVHGLLILERAFEARGYN